MMDVYVLFYEADMHAEFEGVFSTKEAAQNSVKEWCQAVNKPYDHSKWINGANTGRYGKWIIEKSEVLA